MPTNGQGDTSNRGFASMDPDKQKAIASEGGKAAHASGHAYEFTPEEASEAGQKGGQASHGGGPGTPQGGHSSSGTHEQHVQAGKQSHKNS